MTYKDSESDWNLFKKTDDMSHARLSLSGALAHDKRRVLFLIVSISWSASSGADVYRFVDTSGDSFYAGEPPASKVKPLKTAHHDATAGILPLNPDSEFVPEELRDPSSQTLRFKGIIEQEARMAGLDPDLLHAVINAESSYDPLAVSEKGALGLMQLMPATIQRFGVKDPYDPVQNIKGGAKYLSHLMGKFDSDVSLVLAAYNAGEGRVLQYGRSSPPFSETRNYVSRVLRYYNSRE